ncbi:GNAT family N-acetyltransferase [Paraclostridium bifermentans]|uniref:GNAT family N-acetyltransferase n=1 Tax=Paraclostridium bifermentans TaxID=1490 RepID=UPI00115A12A3|nr:GNAT family N-acetyltransferase [Paraclostridium bifermentans]TQO55883.1 GNAT family N-acetyltransferase [Paraclostridium bifermentans]
MIFEFATSKDYNYILEHDKHISKDLIKDKIRDNEIYIAKSKDNKIIGWLRFNYFWDNTPFLNMIFIDEYYREKNIGKEFILFWENKMRNRGFEMVMTSTLANENAQHFYRKLLYRDSGSLLLENEPLEIIFTKKLD